METNKKQLIELLKQSCKNTLMETLSIEFVDVGEDYLTAKMPVTSKVHQPDGILHGGASFALAETVGSFASFALNKKKERVQIRGLEMSGNHIRSISKGFVFATAKPLHMGRTTQIWDIKITTSEKQLVSVFKLTTITFPKK